MTVHAVEGVDRVRVGGESRHVIVDERRGVGPCRPDDGPVAVHGIAGRVAGGGRPREGDPRGGHAGGLEAGGGGGGVGRGPGWWPGGGGGWRGSGGGWRDGDERRRTPRTSWWRRQGWPSRAGRPRRST